MTRKELQAAYDAAVAEAAAKPDDAELKSKVEAAKTALDAFVDPVEPDLDKADEKTKAYIATLRKENAKYRTQAKDASTKLETVTKALGIQGTETAEEKASRLTAERETIAFDNAVLANAVEHGVSKDSMKYFKYLLSEAAQELKDGEELSEARIAEIAKEAKAKVAKPATTTVTTTAGGGTAPPPVGNGETLTVEQFAALGFNAKVKLFDSNPQLYESLFKQASAKRLLK